MESSANIRFKRIKKLGSGGCADAYLAKDSETGRLVTLKCLKSGSDKAIHKAKESLCNEADILKRLRHAGIPKLIGRGADYIAIEYVPGKSLYEMLRKYRRINEKEAAKIGTELVSILSYLHSLPEPVIYRDLKPSNIILRPSGRITLIDYGASRIYREGDKTDTAYLGTCGFAAPEQYGHLGQTDPTTDIYCFGMTLLQIISGIDLKDDRVVEKAKAAGVKGVSPEFMAIIDKCIKPDREDRFKSCEEIGTALRKYPVKVAARKAAMVIKIGLVSACLSAVISLGTTYYPPAKTYIREDAYMRIPAVKERLGVARARIEEYLEEFR